MSRAVFIALVSVALLAGCDEKQSGPTATPPAAPGPKTEAQRLVGRWGASGEPLWVFRQDGTGEIPDPEHPPEAFTYRVQGDTLQVTFRSENAEPFAAKFKFEGDDRLLLVEEAAPPGASTELERLPPP